MSDAAIVEDEVVVGGEDEIPDMTFQEEMDEEIEVIIGNQEDEKPAEKEPDPEKIALQERLEALEASLTAQREQVDLVGAVKELAQNRQAAPVVTQPQGPVETEEEFKARLNENWVDDPYALLMEFNQKKIAPLAQELLATNVIHSKRDLERDPERKDTYKQYEAEIEAEVNSIPPELKIKDPDVYAKAHDRVIGRHINEVIALKVQEALGETKEKPAVTAAPVSHTERGGVGGPPKKRVLRLTPEEAQRAAITGVSQEDYARTLERRRQRAKEGV